MEEEVDLEELGVPVKIDLKNPNFSDIHNYIGFEDLNGFIIEKNKNKRCKIVYKNKVIHGGYGKIQFATRHVNSDKHPIVVKKLIKNSNVNLFKEAFLQHLSHKTLEKYSLKRFIPKVFDIYTKFDTNLLKYILHFSMEEIIGTSIQTFLETCVNPEKYFIHSLIQLCIALDILQNDLNLDHRDLRYCNIFIVNNPLQLLIKGLKEDVEFISDIHISILDFGFACIGVNKTVINAAEGFIHNEERCFKPGRDLFQLIISIWCKDSIRNRMSSEFVEKINSLLRNEEYDFSNLIDKRKDSKWPYYFTNEDNFSFTPLLPRALLEKLVELKKHYSF